MISFAESSPFSVPENTSVELTCHGRALRTYSPAGPIALATSATLTLRTCNWDSFANDAASLDDDAIQGQSFPGVVTSPNAVVHIKDSFMRLPCSVCSQRGVEP